MVYNDVLYLIDMLSINKALRNAVTRNGKQDESPVPIAVMVERIAALTSKANFPLTLFSPSWLFWKKSCDYVTIPRGIPECGTPVQ